MRYVIDTNVLIERGKSKPHPNVKRWFDSLVASQIVLCPVVAAEFMTGVLRLPAGNRAEPIRFLREAIKSFCWIPLDLKTAVAYGDLRASTKTKPRANDLWIASVARANGLIVATRNERDFRPHNIPTINPFQ
jgi:toxin FitB